MLEERFEPSIGSTVFTLAFGDFVHFNCGMPAWQIFGVPGVEHRLILAGDDAAHESVAHFLQTRMQFQILDAELVVCRPHTSGP